MQNRAEYYTIHLLLMPVFFESLNAGVRLVTPPVGIRVCFLWVFEMQHRLPKFWVLLNLDEAQANLCD